MSLALPSYTQWVRKGHRGDAQATLINWANNLEIFRASNNGYNATGALGLDTSYIIRPGYNPAPERNLWLNARYQF